MDYFSIEPNEKYFGCCNLDRCDFGFYEKRVKSCFAPHSLARIVEQNISVAPA
jgi:hypothetical protein